MTKQPPKDAKKPDAAEEREDRLVDEGKPELETPESKPGVPEPTPVLETREAPRPRTTPSPSVPRKPPVFKAEEPKIRPPVVVEEAPVEVEDLSEEDRALLHTSTSPVNSHAPVWTPREPNTKGGYS